MTATLLGRIQTRLFLLATVGVVWTLIVVPFLPKRGAPTGTVYEATFAALLIVALVGIVWEWLYHQAQQHRWEKDWPIMYGLVQGIPEGFVAFLLLRWFRDAGPAGLTFFLHFATTWIIVWIVANGPMRVFLLRWRFLGGRIV